jgi:hypothetical protein
MLNRFGVIRLLKRKSPSKRLSPWVAFNLSAKSCIRGSQKFIAWQNFQILDELRAKLDKILLSLSKDNFGYLTGWSWILTG